DPAERSSFPYKKSSARSRPPRRSSAPSAASASPQILPPVWLPAGAPSTSRQRSSALCARSSGTDAIPCLPIIQRRPDGLVRLFEPRAVRRGQRQRPARPTMLQPEHNGQRLREIRALRPAQAAQPATQDRQQRRQLLQLELEQKVGDRADQGRV